MTLAAPTKRFLSDDDLEKASAFTVVWDKIAVRYFKLGDGYWASSDLKIFTATALAKKRVRFCTS